MYKPNQIDHNKFFLAKLPLLNSERTAPIKQSNKIKQKYIVTNFVGQLTGILLAGNGLFATKFNLDKLASGIMDFQCRDTRG